MKALKISAAIIAAGLIVWIGGFAAEILSAPRAPAYQAQITLLGEQSEYIVERHWNRPDSIPAPVDLLEYENMTKEASAIGVPSSSPELAEARELEKKWSDIYFARFGRMYTIFEWLRPTTGEDAAQVIAGIISGPGMFTAAYHHDAAAVKAQTLRAPSRLTSDLRFHHAMALVLVDDKPGAVKVLRDIIRDDADYALINATYIIGGRADAQNDPDFVAEFTKIGGSTERLIADYTGEKAGKWLHPYLTARFWNGPLR